MEADAQMARDLAAAMESSESSGSDSDSYGEQQLEDPPVPGLL